MLYFFFLKVLSLDPSFGHLYKFLHERYLFYQLFIHKLMHIKDVKPKGNAFISVEIGSSFFIIFSLFSFILGISFISLQIKEFRIIGLSINDSVYSCLFFFLTGLHFFHLLLGLLLLSLLFWSCSFHLLFVPFSKR